ncbi:MAG TPA: TetR family transcriptional regulator, partial [Planctomycetaceae bacterium]|nr:TetR family transcriptional regulator [Planctomycetaceae bacterium]
GTVRRLPDSPARRDQFIYAAHRLVQARGYEQMSHRRRAARRRRFARGLYHYFGSKQSLLEAV